MVRLTPGTGPKASERRTDRLTNSICRGRMRRYGDLYLPGQTNEPPPRFQSFHDYPSETNRADRDSFGLLPGRTLVRCNSLCWNPRRACSSSSHLDSRSAGCERTAAEVRPALRKAQHVLSYWSGDLRL